MTRQDRRLAPLAQHLRVELEPHREHEEGQPYLADRLEVTETGDGKEHDRKARRETPEERRPEHDAGRHLTDDGRLTEALQQASGPPCDRQDDDDLSEEQKQIRDPRSGIHHGEASRRNGRPARRSGRGVAPRTDEQHQSG